ncbi:unnamed protein product [Alternaria alternata]
MAPKRKGKEDNRKARAKTPKLSQQVAVPPTPGLSHGVGNLTVQDPVTPMPKEYYIEQQSQSLVRFRDATVSLVSTSPKLRDAFKQLVQDLSLKAPRQQRYALDAWMVHMASAVDEVYDLIQRVGEHCMTKPALMDKYGSVQAFRDHHPILKEAIDNKTKKGNKIISAVKSIKANKPGLVQECITPCMYKLLGTHTAIIDMSFVLKRMDVQNASLFLNQFALDRIASKGRSNDRFVNAQDWSKIKSFCKDLCKFAKDNVLPNSNKPEHVSEERCKELAELLKDANLGEDNLRFSSQKLRPNLRSYYKAQEFWEAVFKDAAQYLKIPNSKMYCSTHREGEGSHNAGLPKLGIMRHPKFGLAITASTYIPAIDNGRESSVPDRNLDLEIQNVGSHTRRAREHPATSTKERINLERQAGTKVIQQRVNAINTIIYKADAKFPRLGLPPPRTSLSAPKATSAYRNAANALDTSIAEEDEEDDDEAPDTHKEIAAILAPTCSCTNNNSLLLGLIKKMHPIKANIKDPSRFQVIKEWYREVAIEEGGQLDFAPNRDKFRKKMQQDKLEGMYKYFKATGTITSNLFGHLVNDPEISRIITLSFDMYRYHLERLVDNPIWDGFGTCITR